MEQNDIRSLHQIKRETEQTRAGLMDTVEQLRTSVAETANDIRERVSPAAIKAEVSGYVRSRGGHLLEDVSAAARKNPMQAVAVGAGIAYPLLRLARTIPVPVLMVGAGFFLAGTKAGQAVTQKASGVVSDLKSVAADRLDRLTEAVSGGADQVSRAANAAGATLASGLASGTDQLQGTAASIGAAMAGRAADIKDQGERIAGSAAESAREIAASAASVASDLGDRAGKTLRETIEHNPLLVAGVGLVVGGLIASALPRSGIEDGLVGETGNSIKRRAEAAAAQGLDSAGNAVGEAYDEAARQTEAEGLDADGLGKAARDIGQRVRRVAETAVTTAFEPPEDINKSNAQGDTHHG